MHNGDLMTIVKTVNTKEQDCTVAYKLEKNWGVLVLTLGSVNTGDKATVPPVETVHRLLDKAVAAYKAAHPLPTGISPNA